jgi:hypothetical protein
MIIPHTSDSSVPFTDTDKMPDIPAILIEAAENFRRLCMTHKRQCFITVNPTDDVTGRGHIFWSFLSSKMSPTDSLEKRELTDAESNAFYYAIASGVRMVSNGQFALARRVPEEPKEPWQQDDDNPETPETS